MFYEKQHTGGITVENGDLHTIGNSKKTFKRHGPLLPDTMRMLIVGPSNCGKTNVMLSLIESPNGVSFENVYIYAKSLHQPKYVYLEKLLKSIKGIGYYPFSEHEEVIDPRAVKPNSIFIFDDVVCEKQDNVSRIMSFGRHMNCCSYILSQSYIQVPRHLVRENVNILVIFKQNERNLKYIFADHISTDITFDQFKKLCGECWAEGKYNFVVIDKDRELNNGRFRKMFDTFVKFT